MKIIETEFDYIKLIRDDKELYVKEVFEDIFNHPYLLVKLSEKNPKYAIINAETLEVIEYFNNNFFSDKEEIQNRFFFYKDIHNLYQLKHFDRDLNIVYETITKDIEELEVYSYLISELLKKERKYICLPISQFEGDISDFSAIFSFDEKKARLTRESDLFFEIDLLSKNSLIYLVETEKEKFLFFRDKKYRVENIVLTSSSLFTDISISSPIYTMFVKRNKVAQEDLKKLKKYYLSYESFKGDLDIFYRNFKSLIIIFQDQEPIRLHISLLGKLLDLEKRFSNKSIREIHSLISKLALNQKKRAI